MNMKSGVLCVIGCFVIAFAGCGFEDTADIDGFTGTWNWNDGSSMDVNCPNGNDVQSLGGNDTFVEGNSSDLVMIGDECNLDFDVTGNTASIVSGQSCKNDDAELFWSSWTFSRSGNHMTVSASGTGETNSGVQCSLSINGSMDRVGG